MLLFLSVEEVALYKSGAWQLPVLGSLAYIVGSVYTPRFTRMFRAGEKREELAAFIEKIRREEAADEEQQYWDTHKNARRIRDLKSWAERMKYGE